MTLIFKRAVCLLLTAVALVGSIAPCSVLGQKVVPIVDAGAEVGCLMGGTLDGKWTDADKLAPLLRGGETYTVYELTRKVGTVSGAKPVSEGPPCDDTLFVKFSPVMEGENRIGVGGAWNALPRVPKVESTGSATYRAAVATLLRSKGIRRPEVNIVKVVRVDLEGDGVEEVLINATRVDRWQPSGSISNRFKAGDYSLVLLRKVIGGRVQHILVEGEFHPRAVADSVPNEYNIAAVLDLNGDGRMEVVVAGMYYEGAWKNVYTIDGRKVTNVLGCGCGA